ncbi:hypothetical protein HELRODRAFT_185901 [Helobdella robusta]|uniref:Lipase n=1 Tax=Helobdella robusta TaxID=6412 RepID=T1FNF1_HELRO|nr:hypothetical protein HELRODRAFT_185901 [Helobdella robusta]ESN97502.1 hypothetical protein HELRODRAFT_185901 [Helobdella robusta]
MSATRCTLQIMFLILSFKCILSKDPDLRNNIMEMIAYKGYPAEEHFVRTTDGFILGLHRINKMVDCSQREDKNCNANKPAVLLLHGLLESSTSWVLNQPHQSLGYILADAGYDVWMGNVRGNTYSRQHVDYSPRDDKFWNWSWDQMAEYDFPAMVNHIHNRTKQPINFIGFSQGSLIAFSSFSRNQDISNKVKKFIALGPVATVKHVSGFFKYLAKFSIVPETLFKLMGVQEFLPSSFFVDLVAKTVCRVFLLKQMCAIPILIGGLNRYNLNETRLPVYITHSPAGTSVKNLVHFAQMYKSGEFSYYDYKKNNYEYYQQTTVPNYNLKNVHVPTYLFHGSHDKLSTPEDVKFIVENLPNLKNVTLLQGYQHLDFVWGMDAHVRVYKTLLQILQQ